MPAAKPEAKVVKKKPEPAKPAPKKKVDPDLCFIHVKLFILLYLFFSLIF